MKMIVTKRFLKTNLFSNFIFPGVCLSLWLFLFFIVHIYYKPWCSSSLLIWSNRQHGQHIAANQSLSMEPLKDKIFIYINKFFLFLFFTCNRNPVRIFIRSAIKESGQQQKNGVQIHSPARLNTWQQKHGQQKYAQKPLKLKIKKKILFLLLKIHTWTYIITTTTYIFFPFTFKTPNFFS